jgi:hypothetical protein
VLENAARKMWGGQSWQMPQGFGQSPCNPINDAHRIGANFRPARDPVM